MSLYHLSASSDLPPPIPTFHLLYLSCYLSPSIPHRTSPSTPTSSTSQASEASEASQASQSSQSSQRNQQGQTRRTSDLFKEVVQSQHANHNHHTYKFSQHMQTNLGKCQSHSEANRRTGSRTSELGFNRLTRQLFARARFEPEVRSGGHRPAANPRNEATASRQAA